MSGESISVRKRLAYSVVPDVVLEHPILSFAARITLGWMLGRPAGWEIRVGYMLKVLRLTEKTWRRAKRELIQEGFLSQERQKAADGKFVWVQEVTDAPLLAIPPKRMDGECIDAPAEDKAAVNLPEQSKKKAASGKSAASSSAKKDCGLLLGIEFWSAEEKHEIEVLTSAYGEDPVRRAAQQASAARPDGRAFLSAVAPLVSQSSSANAARQAESDFKTRRAAQEAAEQQALLADTKNLERGRQFLDRHRRRNVGDS